MSVCFCNLCLSFYLSMFCASRILYIHIAYCFFLSINNNLPTYLPARLLSANRFNFSVKYDKADTGSIDVDGIKAASLVMEGEMAYGRGWVVLGEDPHYTGIRPGTASRPPSRVNNF